ncbi:hypothetical protein AVEN_118620-1 [Araneus ventricosus]|uniref:Uncharacterized protein n=1 Tax=Araneus ventricosus TaxID=182803 RepID=A0A4Y2AZD4_ARAVE|nr:hypothetical protein AVEN_118620-1 [Araneus ventricosus]
MLSLLSLTQFSHAVLMLGELKPPLTVPNHSNNDDQIPYEESHLQLQNLRHCCTAHTHSIKITVYFKSGKCNEKRHKNFLSGDEVIGDSFQPFLFEVWRWPPYMPRHCEGTLRGTVKCHARSTTTALIAIREVKPFEVGRERAMFRSEDNILSNTVSGIMLCNILLELEHIELHSELENSLE